MSKVYLENSEPSPLSAFYIRNMSIFVLVVCFSQTPLPHPMSDSTDSTNKSDSKIILLFQCFNSNELNKLFIKRCVYSKNGLWYEVSVSKICINFKQISAEIHTALFSTRIAESVLVRQIKKALLTFFMPLKHTFYRKVVLLLLHCFLE